MKVLIISHTVLSKTGNMGKTLLEFFKGFEPKEIAQFYIHSEVPTDDSICHSYYRFTDKDALKSLFSWKDCGSVFKQGDIQKGRAFSRTDTGAIGAVYQWGRKRTGGIYLARNTLWKLARWKTKRFKDWLMAEAPDVIFFASGDYSFLYEMACWVADFLKIPMITTCFDDFYLDDQNAHSLIGRKEHAHLLKIARRTMARSSCILTVCDSMSKQYEKLFRKKCNTIYTPAENKMLKLSETSGAVSYIGNLGFERHKQVIAIGRALRRLGGGTKWVDLYSAEKRPEITTLLTEENGIHFHGQISADEVLNVMSESLAVIHTESFDPKIQDRVRYSVSTKIAESLMYGPCLIAYGPEGIASIDYLKENNAAYVITSPDDLETGLTEILGNKGLREEIIKNARALAQKNHSVDVNPKKVRQWLQEAIDASKQE